MPEIKGNHMYHKKNDGNKRLEQGLGNKYAFLPAACKNKTSTTQSNRDTTPEAPFVLSADLERSMALAFSNGASFSNTESSPTEPKKTDPIAITPKQKEYDGPQCSPRTNFVIVMGQKRLEEVRRQLVPELKEQQEATINHHR